MSIKLSDDGKIATCTLHRTLPPYYNTMSGIKHPLHVLLSRYGPFACDKRYLNTIRTVKYKYKYMYNTIQYSLVQCEAMSHNSEYSVSDVKVMCFCIHVSVGDYFSIIISIWRLKSYSKWDQKSQLYGLRFVFGKRLYLFMYVYFFWWILSSVI